jgi:hypothetical protein
MVHYIITHPTADVIPVGHGKVNFHVIKLNPWTWSRSDILDQLQPKPVVQVSRPEDIPDPEFHVSPIDYNTGFRNGQLIRLHFPIMKSSFF